MRFRKRRNFKKARPSTRRGRNSVGRKKLPSSSRNFLSIVKANAGAPRIPATIPVSVKNTIASAIVAARAPKPIPTPAPPRFTPRPAPKNPVVIRRTPAPPPRRIPPRFTPRPAPIITTPITRSALPSPAPPRADRGFQDIAPPIIQPPPRISVGGRPRTLGNALNSNLVVPDRVQQRILGSRGGGGLDSGGLSGLRLNRTQAGLRLQGEGSGLRGFSTDRAFDDAINDANVRANQVIRESGDRDLLRGDGTIAQLPAKPAPFIKPKPQIITQPIVVSPPAGNVSVNVTSNPSGAEVLVNGTKVNSPNTPSQLFFTLKELLAKKEIRVRRTGYKPKLYYTIQSKIEEEVKIKQVPTDDFGIGFDTSSIDRFRLGGRDRFGGGPSVMGGGISAFTGQPIPLDRNNFNRRIFRKVEERIQVFKVDVKYYENGKQKNFVSDSVSKVFPLHFDLVKNSKVDPDPIDIDIKVPDDTPPPPKVVPELLVVGTTDNAVGKYAATITSKTAPVQRIGLDTFKSKESFEVTIRAKQPQAYQIKKFFVLKNKIEDDVDSRFEEVPAQEITLEVNGPMSCAIEFVKNVPILVPSTRLSGTSFKYNLASPIQIPLGFDSTNSDKTTFKLDRTTLTETGDSGIFTISNKMFNKGVGQYTGYVVPSNNEYGDGTPVRFSINVVNEVRVSTPDIINISYPQLLKGADFAGYNVPFSVQYQSVNTNFVNIYLGNKNIPYGKFSPNQSVEFNVESIIKKLDGKYKEDGDSIIFTILLQPHNTSTKKEVIGKLEAIDIEFVKSDLELPRDTTIEQLCDGFDFDTSLFDDDTSKYLTHLAHFGAGDNKLITTWDTDDQTFAEYDTNNLLQLPDPNNKTGGFDALVLKMYEPLPKEVQPNQELWISKIVTRPVIEEVSIVDDSEEFCVQLKGPNFMVNDCGAPADTGFEIIDGLVASGSESSAKLIDTFVSSSGVDTKKLNIEYVSSSYDFIETEKGYSVDGTVSEAYRFDNFVHFGSAEERARNYFYKLSLLETYKNGIATIESGSGSSTGSLSLLREKESLQKKINDVKANFDGFEHFLTDSTSSLAFPKESDGVSLQSTGSSDSIAWYNTLLVSSSAYDKDNVDYLPNNIPNYIKNDDEQTDFIMFLDMIGHHFDILWTYITALKKNIKVEEKQRVGISDDMLKHILKNYSWIPHSSQSTKRLWEYALGYRDSKQTSKLIKSGKEYENTIWRRILNNLPYLLKHKGTRRGLSAVLSTYGIPSSLLTIMEFGGPRQQDSQTTTFTFDDRTSAVVLPNATDDASILVDWKLENGVSSSHAIEARFRTSQQHTQSLISNEPYWNITLEHQHGVTGRLNFSSSFGEVITESGSLFNNEFTQLVVNVNHHSASENGTSESIELVAMQDFQSRIRMGISSSTDFTSSINAFYSGSQIEFGTGFTGSFDEIRIWSSSLSSSVIQDHTLFPEKISGNHISSSTEDLMLRLDFEKPKNLNTNTVIPNVAPDTGSNGTIRYASSATASNFDDNSTYPFHYEVYDRQVTAKVPSMGFGPADKFRFESASLVQNLSYRQRATKKAFDSAPLDSNQLGIFLSPNKELNMDIIKSLPDFVIDDYIGDPSHQYLDDYPDLEGLREYVFGRYNLNIYEYINIIKYIDKSLFETIRQMIPARVKVMDGLLIEPHFLERNKEERKKPQAELMESKEGVQDISKNSIVDITSSVEMEQADLDLENLIEFEPSIPQHETSISESSQPSLLINYNDVNAIITDTEVTEVSASRLDYNVILDAESSQSKLLEVDVLNSEIIGLDPDGLAKNGFGLGPAKNGFILRTTRDKFNNYKKEKLRVWVVKKEKKFKQKVQLNPLDSSLGTIVSESAVRTKTIISFTSPSGSLANSVGTVDPDGTIVQVTALNGYLPTHHRNTSDLTTGMENLYFKGCKQTQATTLDGTPPVEVFTTNPNTLKVSDSGRGSGEPILEIE